MAMPLNYLGAGASGLTNPVVPAGPIARPPAPPPGLTADLPPISVPSPSLPPAGPIPGAAMGLQSILAGALAGPELPQYLTVTQEDGSILIRVKNPDGSPGPVRKVLPPIKEPGVSAAPR